MLSPARASRARTAAVPVPRRRVLVGLAVASAALVAGPAAAAPSSGTLRLGDVTVETFSDGTLSSSLAFTLPKTPEAEAAALFAAEGLPPVITPIPTNASLIRTGDEVVLVDAGSGNSFQATAGRLAESLERAGVRPEAVTKVVFTHGHADHLWGALDDFDDSERFPNASYVVSADEWDFWTRPDIDSALPDWLKGMAVGTRRRLKRLEPRIERRRPGENIARGLAYVATPGHTPGHASVLVSGGREQALVGGDALSHALISFRRPAWAFGTDLDPDQAADTRLRLLDRLASERTTLVGFHLPGSGIGRVERAGGTYRFVPA